MSTEIFTVGSTPHAPLRVICKKGEPGVYLLLDPDTPNWVIVDDLGRDIVDLCDGKRTLEEIIKTLCTKYGELYEESVAYVLAFANELKTKEFLQEQKFPPCSSPDKKNKPLRSMWINVTNQCNLRCMHCHLSSGLPFQNELTTEEIFQVISDAAALGLKNLVVTGGEPLLHKDILRILEYGSQYADKMALLTNGTLITEEIAEKLSDIGLQIQVSLDGTCEETHEFIRGKGSYRKALSGLENLVKAGAQPLISMTILKGNLNEISEMADLAEKLGIKYLHFPILQIKGRAKENESVITLEDEDLVTATKKILEISKTRDIEITVEKNFRDKIEKMQKKDFCEAGCSAVSIAADGKVYPCSALHEDEFCAGHIRNQQLKDIWKESEVLHRFRSCSMLDTPECKTCEIKFFCGSGCHVDRYFAHGRLDVPTPVCKAQKEIYWHLLSEKMKEAQVNL